MVGFNDKFKKYWTDTVKPHTEKCTPEAEKLYELPDLSEADQKKLLDSMIEYRDLPGQVYIAEMRDIIDMAIEENVVDEDVMDVLYQIQSTLNSQEYWDLAFPGEFANCDEAVGRRELKNMMNELVGLV